MEIEPENTEQEKKPAADQQGQDNEELAKEIPTVTPDDDNLEAGPKDEDTGK